MHLSPWMNVMLDFIWTLPIQLEEHEASENYKKNFFIVGFNPSQGMVSSLQVELLNL